MGESERSAGLDFVCDQPPHQPLGILEVMLAPSRGASRTTTISTFLCTSIPAIL
jgi:hypothetical protein